MKISKVLTHYWETTGQYAKSWRAIQSRIKHLNSLGDVDAQSLTPSMLKQYANRRPVQPATVRQELTLLKAALNMAKGDGVIEDFCAIPLPSKSPEKNSYLTKDQLDRFLQVAGDVHPELPLFLKLGFSTGARKSAVLSLTADHIDFTAGMVWYSKQGYSDNKKKVDVPMSSSLSAYLRGLAFEGSLFSSQLRTSINYYWNKAVKASGLIIDDFTPHIMRRTLATQMAMAGKDLYQVAIILGDDVETVQRRYARFHPNYQRAAVEVDFI